MALHGPVRRDFVTLTAGIAVVGLAMGASLPASTLRLEELGADASRIGLWLALHALGLVMATPLSTRWFRWTHPRRALCQATAGAAVAVLGMELAHTLTAMALGLWGLGLMLGVVFNGVESWVNDILPDGERGQWVAIHCTVFTLFQMAGPLALSQLSGHGAFIGTAAVLMLTAVLFARVGDPPGLTEEATAAGSWWQLLWRTPAIVWGTVLFALFDALVLGLLPFYGRQQGLSDAHSLWSASVVLAGDTALEWLVGWLADRLGRQRMQWLCALLLLLAMPALPLTLGHWTWWPTLFLMGGAAGGIYVLSMMACGQRYRGARLLQMTALLRGAWGIASCVGPLATGALMTISVAWALPTVLGLTTLLLMLALRIEARSADDEINK